MFTLKSCFITHVLCNIVSVVMTSAMDEGDTTSPITLSGHSTALTILPTM